MAHGDGWPIVRYEEHRWVPTRGYGTSRSAVRRHQGPYRAAIVPEIARLGLALSAEAHLAAEDALQELARFDAESGSDSGFGPLAAVLLRTESASSSQIEHLTAGARQIAIADLGEPAAHNAELIAANTKAMEAAIRLSGALSIEAIISMQRALLGPAGTSGWRTEQVWIGGYATGPHHAHFVPPHPERVPAAMADLEKFMNRDDLPVLQQAAISHAHFETIHPFPDGNGRTGRALLQAQLRGKGIIRSVTVPVSAGLLTDTDRYFAALDSYRLGKPGDIVIVLSDAVFAAVANARILRDNLRKVTAGWKTSLTARSDSVAWRILEQLPAQPVVNSDWVTDTFEVSGVAAQRALRQLEETGILREFTGRKRSRLFVADEIIDELDAFAERTGRR